MRKRVTRRATLTDIAQRKTALDIGLTETADLKVIDRGIGLTMSAGRTSSGLLPTEPTVSAAMKAAVMTVSAVMRAAATTVEIVMSAILAMIGTGLAAHKKTLLVTTSADNPAGPSRRRRLALRAMATSPNPRLLKNPTILQRGYWPAPRTL